MQSISITGHIPRPKLFQSCNDLLPIKRHLSAWSASMGRFRVGYHNGRSNRRSDWVQERAKRLASESQVSKNLPELQSPDLERGRADSSSNISLNTTQCKKKTFLRETIDFITDGSKDGKNRNYLTFRIQNGYVELVRTAKGLYNVALILMGGLRPFCWRKSQNYKSDHAITTHIAFGCTQNAL